MKQNQFVSVLALVFRSARCPESLPVALRCLALVTCFVIGLATSPSEAQSPAQIDAVKIAVIDFRGVLSKSDAARSIREAVDGERAVYRDRFSKLEKELLDEQNALVQRRAILSVDAFEEQATQLKEKTRRAQQDAQAGNQNLKQAFDKAMDTVQKALFKVVAELADETGVGVVLFRSSIVIAAKQLEVSDAALQRLNEKLPRVDVVFDSEKG